MAGAADRIAAGRRSRRRRAIRASCGSAPSRRRTTSAGDINGQPFEWIADADSRLGPVLEAVINGRYYWVPFARLAAVDVEAPEDLRDMVWMPAQLQFENGGESVALIPTRYPGSETSDDGWSCWRARPSGKKSPPTLITASASASSPPTPMDVPLMELRTLVIRTGAAEAGGAGA